MPFSGVVESYNTVDSEQKSRCDIVFSFPLMAIAAIILLQRRNVPSHIEGHTPVAAGSISRTLIESWDSL